MEDELSQLIHRKKELDRNIATLEVQIYNSEGRYLEQTQQFGNTIKGFEGYLSTTGSGGSSALNPGNLGSYAASGGIPETDRLFSHSSSTYKKVCISSVKVFNCEQKVVYSRLYSMLETLHSHAFAYAGPANHSGHGRSCKYSSQQRQCIVSHN